MLHVRTFSNALKYQLCFPSRSFSTSRFLRNATKPYYVTTPLFYVNAEPHIGHLHSLVLADVFKRFSDFKSDTSAPKAMLLTGTDEHGMKIQKAAESKGVTPRELCDTVSKRFEALADAAGVEYDIFYRTSTAEHAKAVQHIWQVFESKGLIYKAQYEGWYSVSDETYYTESQVRDQTDASGQSSKVAIESGQPVEWQQEENYMFRLSQFREPLIKWLEGNADAVRPAARYAELLQSLNSGPLADLSVSRPRSRLQWGVEVPGDPSHTIYVWIDALSNYLIATGYPSKCDGAAWPADIHVVGKDIIRFHAVYWPAMLMALDLPLPRTVLAHAHWTMDQMKMSKSRGNVVNPFESLERFSRDGIRSFLMFRGGLEHDADFALKHVERDYRKYLAGQTGNLLQRLESKALLKKAQHALTFDGMPSDDAKSADLARLLQSLPGQVEDAILSFRPSSALTAIFEALGEANAYTTIKEPWSLKDEAALAECLSLLLEALRKTSLLLQPFIPDSATMLLDRLGIDSSARTLEHAKTDERGIGLKRFVNTAAKIAHKPPIFNAMPKAKKTQSA